MFDAPSIAHLIRRHAADPALRNRNALEAADGALTYAQLAERIERVSGALLARGMPRGARVALLGGRNAKIVTTPFGALAAGGAACILDPHAATHELASRLKIAEIGWLVYEPAFESVARALDVPHKLGLDQASGHARDCVTDLVTDEDALLLFTSGSTGVAKTVRVTHGNMLANAYGVGERTGVTPDDRVLHAMPLHHTNGTNNQLAVPFTYGACVVMLERYNAETFFEAIAAARPTYVTGVPTMYLRLLAHRPPPGALRTLRFLRSGAAPITVEEHRAIEAHLGLPLIMSYGLSEATCTAAMNPPDAYKIGSVGPALDGVQVAIFRPGGEEWLAAEAEGEICIAGPTVMRGYVGQDASGDGPSISNGWLRTGDLGRMDADGYLSITGRLKDLIIRGGENLSPAAIEAALLAHPDVKRCCVIGVPHADLGEVPVAFVVAANGQTPPAAAMLRTAVRERLSRTHMPQKVIYLDTLPENSIGKVDKRALRMLAES